MSDIAIKVENLSKQYRLGEVGTGTISHDLNRWWAKMRGKEDPFLKIGETNDRSKKGDSDYVWALKDINFEVKKGEVLGIIGKNGAGKSTLLKILSKVTGPTIGEIKGFGRIASLLEVGTGFHPELTGRENIYLNGTILGMTKAEVSKKLDEIVDFAGVERYLDTPVKRYSSGMMVRLGFAVAAHLEPEILIIDEVLAVGDAEFQKKAIGKMEEVSKGEGRTVLFVSHNMDSIKSICTSSIVLYNGTISFCGNVDDAISNYISNIQKRSAVSYIYADSPGNEFAKIKSIKIINSNNELSNQFYTDDCFEIEIEYWDINDLSTNTSIIHIKNQYNQLLFASNEFNSSNWKKIHETSGLIRARCRIPAKLLQPGVYSVLVAIGCYNPNIVHVLLDNIVSFEIQETYSISSEKGKITGEWPGLIRPHLEWFVEKC